MGKYGNKQAAFKKLVPFCRNTADNSDMFLTGPFERGKAAAEDVPRLPAAGYLVIFKDGETIEQKLEKKGFEKHID